MYEHARGVQSFDIDRFNVGSVRRRWRWLPMMVFLLLPHPEALAASAAASASFDDCVGSSFNCMSLRDDDATNGLTRANAVAGDRTGTQDTPGGGGYAGGGLGSIGAGSRAVAKKTPPNNLDDVIDSKGRSTASWSDFVTVQSAQLTAGQQAIVKVRLRADGRIAVSSGPAGAAGGGAGGTVSVSAEIRDSLQQVVGFDFFDGSCVSSQGIQTGDRCGTVDKTIDLTFLATKAGRYKISATIETSANGGTGFGSSSFGSSFVSFGNTLSWEGIVEATNFSGNPINISLLSDDGIDYAQPVPEPGSGLIGVASVATLIALRRRRRGRIGRNSLAALMVGAVVLVASAGSALDAPPHPSVTSTSSGPEPSMQREIAAREYEVSRSERGMQAPNRAQSFRTYFEPDGIRVHERAGSERELASLRLAGWGRADALSPAGAGVVTSQGSRVEIARNGVTEWFENLPAGVEHGFTVGAAPPGEGPLVFELTVGGTHVALRDGSVTFVSSSGRRLSYGALVARDAAGALLPARLEVQGDSGIQILVEDNGALYPLEIDPLLTSERDANFTIDLEDSFTGFSVASAGDVNGDGASDVIVGVPKFDGGQTNEGKFGIFYGDAAGFGFGPAPTQVESDQAEAQFGISVAGIGDVNGDGYDDVAAGAYLWGTDDEGAVFVFLGGPNGITATTAAQADARLESNQPDSSFGYTIAGAGDVNRDGFADLIVGAQGYDAGEADEGAAFVFLGSAVGIADGSPATASAQLESNQNSAGMGLGVSGAKDVNGDGYADVIVGAPGFDAGLGSPSPEGAAFVFEGSATGVHDSGPLGASAVLRSNDPGAGMGYAVGGAGDINGDGFSDVIVGASLTGANDVGTAYIFNGSAVGVSDGGPSAAATKITGDDPDGYVGSSVAPAGDVNGDGLADVIVGARFYQSGGGAGTGAGAAFVFFGRTDGIPNGGPDSADVVLSPMDLGTAPNYGFAVAGVGDVNEDGYADVAVGAPTATVAALNDGIVELFYGSAEAIRSGLLVDAATRTESDQANAALGTSVASAGDVNGDGFDDVIVGAPRYDRGSNDEGAAFILMGSAEGIATGDAEAADTILESNRIGALLGSSVASAGDVNGDGYADVIVGAPYYEAGQGREGAVFIFHGGAQGIANGTPATAATRLESNQIMEPAFGGSVAGAGDVNGDGYADVIVGARFYDAGQDDEGAAFVFLGGAMGITDGSPATAAAQLESDQMTAALGTSVASAGDVNGDGYADVIVGAPGYENLGGMRDGLALVFTGGPSGIADGDPGEAASLISSQGNTSYLDLGASVSSAGDVNGDGYGDVIVGDPYFGAGGRAAVLLGSPQGIASGLPDGANIDGGGDSALGDSVSSAGDVNGDGYGDVIIGAPLFGGDGGAALVFLGSPTGMASGDESTADARIDYGAAAHQVGYASSVAGAGDVNADGFADVIVGAPEFDAGQGAGEGASFVFLGNGDGDGRIVQVQQRRGDGSGAPVQPWGRSYSGTSFQVSMRATDPRGRGRAKLEVERCPKGVAFGSAGCSKTVSPSWIDTTATSGGTTLSQTISGLVQGTLYHWRARLLYAAFSVTAPGIGGPPAPSHGPWRRVHAQATESDLRALVPEADTMLLGLTSAATLLAISRRRRR
jgi:hypothetical protein